MNCINQKEKNDFFPEESIDGMLLEITHFMTYVTGNRKIRLFQICGIKRKMIIETIFPVIICLSAWTTFCENRNLDIRNHFAINVE